MPSKETEKASEGYSAKIPCLYLGVPYPSEDLTSQFPTADQKVEEEEGEAGIDSAEKLPARQREGDQKQN